MKKTLTAFTIAIILIITVAFTMVEVLAFFGKVPDTKAVTGSELSDSAKGDLVQSGIITNAEKIYYFYSEDFVSFIDYGNLFTDQRVISYELDQDSDERTLYSANYAEISDIQFHQSQDLLEDSTIEIFVDEELAFMLYVSTERRRDQAFFSKLIKVWESANNDDHT